MIPSRLIILGTGYTGHRIYAAAKARGSRVWTTSRHPERRLPHIDAGDRLVFDLASPRTWDGLPSDCDAIWCFPAEPIRFVRKFVENRPRAIRRLLVLGSTSAYIDSDLSRTSPPPWLNESAPVDAAQPRVQGEEYLRTHWGAIVLRVAGIYGPGRNPLDWIRQHRVASSPRYVNLIHVEDLAGVCLELCERSPPGEVYNVSDGTPRTWRAICRVAQTHWAIHPSDTDTRGGIGKRIDTAKLRGAIEYVFKYPDLYDALRSLEPPPAGSKQGEHARPGGVGA
jgi:nucleoside-diphosphate-sugar epimerase